ncbi:MAG: rhodanese-like domain-containing protein [Verrucomicrobiota bacterium]
MKELNPSELQARLSQPGPVQLVDVRQPEEWALARLPGAVLIPLGEFVARGPEELDPGQPVVLYCHHGMRSAQAAAYLLSRGFGDVTNLTGGIDRWSLEVDPTVPRY